MIRLDEDDVPGNPGAAETPEIEARRLALEALSRPLDLDPPGYEGESAEVMSQARGLPSPARARPTLGGDALMAGMGPDDAIAPGRAAPSRVVLSEEDVPAFTAPARPAASAAPAMMANIAPFSTRAAPPPQAPKSASRETALDADLRGASEQRARRMIANTLGAGVEVLGSLSSGVPIQPGRPVMAGAGEDEAAIRARHRAAQMEKEQGARAESLAASRAEREATLEDRDFQLRQRGMDIAEQRANRTETPSDLDAARSEQIRAALADREARRDPFSPQSRAAQGQFQAVLDAMPQRLRPATFTPESIRGMSADELAAPTSQLSRIVPRATGGGTGGGGGGQAAAARREALIDAYMQRTNSSREEAESVVGALGAERAASSLASDALARGRTSARMQSEGEEILPGVRAGVDLSPGEARAIRTGFASMRSSLDNMREVEAIAQRYGRSGVISPEARAEMRPRLVTLRAMVAQMGNTGVINPSEVPTINAALPNPTDAEQMTVGDFNAQLRAWRQQLETSVQSGLAARGVDEDGMSSAMRLLRGGSAPRRAAPSSDRVTVRGPDGTVGTLPRAQLAAARARGYEVVDAPR